MSRGQHKDLICSMQKMSIDPSVLISVWFLLQQFRLPAADMSVSPHPHSSAFQTVLSTNSVLLFKKNWKEK